MSGITFQVNADFAAFLLKRFTLEAEQTSGVSAHSNPILGKFCTNVCTSQLAWTSIHDVFIIGEVG